MSYTIFQFDRFRRKLIEYTFSGGVPSTVDHELDDDELLDHVRQMAHDKLSLAEEIQQYASSESEVRTPQKLVDLTLVVVSARNQFLK